MIRNDPAALWAAFAAPAPPPPHGGTVGRPTPDDVLKRPALIVEDEAIIAWMMESVLEDMGFVEVAIADNAEAAVEIAARLRPGLVVSDINLGPGATDGVAAAAAMLADCAPAVVFVTAYASADAAERIARDVPGAKVLRKPVADTELRAAIVEVSGATGH